MDPQGHGMIGWVNLAYQSEDDEMGFDFEDEYLSDDFFSDEELLSESEESYLFDESETDDGAEDHVGQPSVRLLLTGEGEVQQHGIHTSVPHHQCCDALSLADADSDNLVFTEGKFAALYDMGQQVLVSAVDLGFKPYSIARHEDMFAAVGTRDVKIFFLQPDPKKGNVITFQPTAEFRVGALGASSNMNNGVRFGRCGTEWKLFVASQDCFLYVFNVPGAAASNTSKSGAGAPSAGGKQVAQVAVKDFLSSSLKKQYCSALDRQPGIVRREPPMVRGPDGEELKTDLIGRFKVPLNCVAASPDGRLLAVVGDSSCVWVLDRASGYSTSNMASFSLDSRTRRSCLRGYKGCQYVAWNSSSDLLAASSDTDCIVRVWRVKAPANRRRTRSSSGDVATGEVVGTYNHNHPCLALQFSPVDPYLLFYTEVPTSSPGISPSLHAADLHGPPEAFQTILLSDFPGSCPAAQFSSGGCNGGHSTVLECIKGQCPGYRKWQKPTPHRPDPVRALPRLLYSTTGGVAQPQVTGLAVSRKHGVLLSLHGGGENGTRNQVLQFRPLEWSLERHRLFPEGFKETTRFILLAASSTLQVPPEEPGPSSAESSSSSSFRSLPKDLVYSIIEKAATPQGAWIPRTSPSEEAEAGRDGPKRPSSRVPGAVVFQAGPDR